MGCSIGSDINNRTGGWDSAAVGLLAWLRPSSGLWERLVYLMSVGVVSLCLILYSEILPLGRDRKLANTSALLQMGKEGKCNHS